MSLEAGFQLCSVPVTRRLYALFDPRHADQHDDYDKYSPEPRCPAIYLSYWDSVMFSVWAHGRLPTEWEWEYASRGGQDRAGNDQPIWWWGNDESQLVKYAWVSDNSDICTHPVGDKPANGFGLHDMLGNVWEWTSSRYDVTDSTSVSRVVRGGSFFIDAILARCSRRADDDPSSSDDDSGCRVARAEIRKP
jgi:formylglycine-generating enzyme required for sulfatase activity